MTDGRDRLRERLDESPVVQAARSVFGEAEGFWIVGGAIRDALAGRPVLDLDLAVAGEPEALARELARDVKGAAFELSESFGAWRVVGPARVWRIDLASLRGPDIESDLRGRDYTVNAMAVPLHGAELIDPCGGAADIEQRLLRVVAPAALEEDPLRLLRGPRIAAELELSPDAETTLAARERAERAGEPAGERQFSELRLAIAGRDPLRALDLMDEFGITGSVLPELEDLRGVEQNPYHHLDVFDHTRAVLTEWLELERDPGRLFPEHADELVAWLEQPLADELNRGEAIRFGALCHDLGKPQTRSVNEEGRILFLEHDRVGEEIVRRLGERLRMSRRLIHELELLTRHHLGLGFLVHERPLDRRTVYRYLRDTDPVSLDVTLLSVADRLATRGERTRQEAIDEHLELAREMVGECLSWQDAPPEVPLRGDELAEALGLEHGPLLGELLEELREAVFAGEVNDREEAIAMAREHLKESQA